MSEIYFSMPAGFKFKKVQCPECQVELELVYEEVDIGVGVQRSVTGACCPKCNKGYTPCISCGAWEFETHPSWCGTLPVDEELPF